MDLKPTRLEHVYEVGDESGYRFTVVAVFDPETGWSASVSMATHGYKTPEHAVAHLTLSARAFIRQVAPEAP